MKNIVKIFFVLLFSTVAISCENEDQATLTETAKSTISPDKTTVVLDKNNPDNPVLNISWSKSSFNLAVISTQQLQFALKGKNFAGSSNVDVPTSTLSFTSKQLNDMALTLGAVPDTNAQIEVRLRTTVGTGMFYSDVVTLTYTPYIAGPLYNFADLYLIGDATAGSWDNAAGNTKIYPLVKSGTAGNYTFTGYFAAGGFKIIKTPGSWATQYGAGSSAGVLDTSGGSGNISVAAAGYYKLTVNTTALTYTFVPVTAPTVTYTAISMIGPAAGGWSTDLDLQQSTFDPHMWTKKNVMLSAGEFKFRANHDWATSWGVGQEFFGTATLGGANIPLATAYHYDVYFNDMTGDYSLIPVN